MARTLWLLALLSAFFVVAVRCLIALPSSATSASVATGSEARPSSDETDEGSSADLEEDSDDNADPLPALAARAPVRLVALQDAEGAGLFCGALVAQRALPSHAASLERPPRG